ELWELSSQRGLISVHRGLSHRRSYYQLTGRGASMLGVSEYWAGPLGAQSLITNLSIAWFCCMGRPERRRVEQAALSRRLGFDVPGGNYCVEKNGNRFRTYRISVPMPGPAVRDIVRAAEELLSTTAEHAGLDRFLAEKTLGFAVLVDSPMRAEAI